MWFCEGRTMTLSYKGRFFQIVLSISPLVDERCFVLKYGFWERPNFYIERKIELWEKTIFFATSICKETLFSTKFVFSALPSERSTLNTKNTCEMRKNNMFRNNLSCRTIEVACFQTWFMFMAMRLFVELCGLKPSFSKWIRERTTFLETNCTW